MSAIFKHLAGDPLFVPNNALYFTVKDGTAETPTASSIAYSNGGFRIVFTGEFAITGGTVSSGTVTGFDLVAGATKLIHAAGYSVPYSDLGGAIDTLKNTLSSDAFEGLFLDGVKVGGSKSGDTLHTTNGGKIAGHGGNDYLYAQLGSVVMKGGAGDDVLVGNGLSKMFGDDGTDVFAINGDAGGDRIKDFDVDSDVVAISPFAFDVPDGFLGESYFAIGEAAESPGERVIYDKKTGVLSYDADGSGLGEETVLAVLDKHLKLHADNIFVGDFT